MFAGGVLTLRIRSSVADQADRDSAGSLDQAWQLLEQYTKQDAQQSSESRSGTTPDQRVELRDAVLVALL